MRLLFSFCATLLMMACSNPSGETASDYFSIPIEHHLISSGDNRPAINLYRDSVDYFLFALHKGANAADFARQAGWSDSLLQARTTDLTKAGFLKKGKGDSLHPACMIITRKEGEWLFAQSESIAREIADSIIMIIPSIKLKYENLSTAEKFRFEEFSFFLLSNVLLDNWQINNVENGFVKQPRTPRHGKNYYYQVAETNADDSIESFGIYGNQVRCNDTICAAVYGNRRIGINLENYFHRNDIPFLTPADETLCKEMANSFSATLIGILNKQKQYLESIYAQSVYRNEISFAEFFMWHYHFIYTRATDILAEKGSIRMPDDNNFFYSGK